MKKLVDSRPIAAGLVRETYLCTRDIPAPVTAPRVLREPGELAECVRAFMSTEGMNADNEHFFTVTMNTRRRVLGIQRVTSGTATASLAHPREVFRLAVMQGASCVAVAHNHPSGDPEPSSADVGITRQLREAARVLGIELCDHVIIGVPGADPSGKGYFSFRLAGLM